MIGSDHARSNAVRLAVCRILVAAAILYWDNIYFLSKWNSSMMYSEWHPIAPFSLLMDGPLGIDVLRVIKALWFGTGLAFLVGLFSIITGPVFFALSLFVMGYDYNFGEIYHANQMIVMILGVLAFSRSSDVLSFDARLKSISKRGEPQLLASWVYRWPLVAGGLLFTLVYASASFTKLVRGHGFGWAWSENLAIRLFQSLSDRGTANWLLDQDPTVVRVVALAVLIWQMCTVVMVFTPRLWWLWLMTVIGFHFGVRLVFGGHGPFFVNLACFSFFIPFERWVTTNPFDRKGRVPETD